LYRVSGPKGKFGLPRVLKPYTMESTATFVPSKEFLTYRSWDAQMRLVEPEVRIHRRSLILDSGKRLLDCDNPHTTITAVYHAMAAHYVCHDAGWLQRDVSCDNVLYLETPLVRDAPGGLPCIAAPKECRGILIDDDMAIKVTDATKDHLTHGRSGTLPFISIRLLTLWQNSPPPVHTPLDDHESFVWIVIWIIINHIVAKGKASAQIRHWLTSLSSDDINLVISAKTKITSAIGEDSFDDQGGEAFDPFELLLPKLFTIVDAAKRKLQEHQREKKKSGTITDLNRTVIKDFYKQYFECFDQYLTSTVLTRRCPTSWDYLDDVSDPRVVPEVPEESLPPNHP